MADQAFAGLSGGPVPVSAIPVTSIGRDTTVRLPCRQGDFLLWLRWKGIFADLADPTDPMAMLDYWELHDGDHVTITNRFADLPAWFELHPTEARGGLAFDMMRRLDGGYQAREIVEGPNLWRLQPGDWVAWVGAARMGYASMDGTLAVFEIRECALAAGESTQVPERPWIFGAPSQAKIDPADVTRCRRAIAAIRQLGTPREWGEGWGLG